MYTIFRPTWDLVANPLRLLCRDGEMVNCHTATRSEVTDRRRRSEIFSVVPVNDPPDMLTQVKEKRNKWVSSSQYT